MQPVEKMRKLKLIRYRGSAKGGTTYLSLRRAINDWRRGDL